MSLLVWLPLDDNLNNQGISNTAITTSTSVPASQTGGQIGNCYYCNNQYIRGTFYATNTMSFCIWAKFAGTSTKSAHLLDCRNTNASTGYQPMYITSGVIQIGGTGSAFPNISYTWKPNIWYHIAVCYCPSGTNLYVNGIKQGSGQYTNTSSKGVAFNQELPFTIASRCNQSNYQNVYVNDFRIYDHMLSAAEVKELAQGLAIHYKLDGGDRKANPNLATTSADYRTQQYGYEYAMSGWGGDAGKVTYYKSGGYNNLPYRDVHKTAAGSGGIFRKISNDITIESGVTYTFSCWIKADRSFSASAHTFNINRSTDNAYITHNGNLNITTDWKLFSRTFTATSSQAGSWGDMSIVYDDGVADYHVYYSGFKIEKGSVPTPWVSPDETGFDIITDSSGFHHHGVASAPVLLNNDTARYLKCTTLNTTTSINVPIVTPSAITVAFWMKRSRDTASRQFLYTAWPGITCELYSNNQMRTSINNQSGSQVGPSGSSVTVADGWTHFCSTYDGINTMKLYKNGQLVSSSSVGVIKWNVPAGGANIGKYSSLDKYEGYMSDFRLYCTELSADDVRRLYETSLRIDKSKRMHTFELNESEANNKTKVSHSGMLSTQTINEDVKAAIYDTISVEADEFIEI